MNPMETVVKTRSKPIGPDPLDPAMVLTFADISLIGKMMRKNLSGKEDLLATIASLNMVSVEGVAVTLEPRLLQRLKSRCLDKDRFSGWLAEVVVKQLHDYAGW